MRPRSPKRPSLTTYAMPALRSFQLAPVAATRGPPARSQRVTRPRTPAVAGQVGGSAQTPGPRGVVLGGEPLGGLDQPGRRRGFVVAGGDDRELERVGDLLALLAVPAGEEAAERAGAFRHSGREQGQGLAELVGAHGDSYRRGNGGAGEGEGWGRDRVAGWPRSVERGPVSCAQPDGGAQSSWTVTPPEKSESCSSSLASLAFLGMSKTRMPVMALPGLISLKKVSASLLA